MWEKNDYSLVPLGCLQMQQYRQDADVTRARFKGNVSRQVGRNHCESKRHEGPQALFVSFQPSQAGKQTSYCSGFLTPIHPKDKSRDWAPLGSHPWDEAAVTACAAPLQCHSQLASPWLGCFPSDSMGAR